jgi:hypothetical protein
MLDKPRPSNHIARMQTDSPLDPLDAEIAAARLAVAEARDRLKMSGAILEVLERIKVSQSGVGRSQKFHPPMAPYRAAPDSPQISGKRGKAPGSLSSQWRKIMAKIVAAGNDPMHPDYWCIAAAEAGFPAMEVKAARDWLRRAAASEYGFILKHGDGFNVSAAAVKKFHLRAPEPPPEVSGGGSA